MALSSGSELYKDFWSSSDVQVLSCQDKTMNDNISLSQPGSITWLHGSVGYGSFNLKNVGLWAHVQSTSEESLRDITNTCA